MAVLEKAIENNKTQIAIPETETEREEFKFTVEDFLTEIGLLETLPVEGWKIMEITSPDYTIGTPIEIGVNAQWLEATSIVNLESQIVIIPNMRGG